MFNKTKKRIQEIEHLVEIYLRKKTYFPRKKKKNYFF